MVLKRGQRRLGREVRIGMESHGRSMKEEMEKGLGLLAVAVASLTLTPAVAALASWLRKPDR
jgi:hypothetical protein